MVEFLYCIPQVNQFLGPELFCLFPLNTLNFQLIGNPIISFFQPQFSRFCKKKPKRSSIFSVLV